MQPQQLGYNSSRVYLELLADPWQKASEEQELNLKAAKEQIDFDHYGLMKVKQRIIEYLAVRKFKPDARENLYVYPLLVLRMRLIYEDIGSMLERLIDGLKRVGVCNPVMLLDEIDKTGSDVPASALLEVLNPEQNKSSNDHYLNVSFDISKAIFVATANRMQPIPPPLLD